MVTHTPGSSASGGPGDGPLTQFTTGSVHRADYSPADWDDVLDVNVRGVAYGVSAVYPIMKAQGAGHIVNTASVCGLISPPGSGPYNASKHAVVAISETLALELADGLWAVRVALGTLSRYGGAFDRGIEVLEPALTDPRCRQQVLRRGDQPVPLGERFPSLLDDRANDRFDLGAPPAVAATVATGTVLTRRR